MKKNGLIALMAISLFTLGCEESSKPYKLTKVTKSNANGIIYSAQFIYDDQGRLTQFDVKDENDSSIADYAKFSYDNDGNLVKMEEKGGSDPLITSYSYSDTNITQTSNGGHIIIYTLNDNGQVIKEEDANRKNHYSTFNYDTKGNMVMRKEHKNNALVFSEEYQYDTMHHPLAVDNSFLAFKLGRLTMKQNAFVNNAIKLVHKEYEKNDDDTSYNASNTYKYNDEGLPTQKTVKDDDGFLYTLNYSYVSE